ncbi:ankyrin repeat-containing domain protein [Xylariaceae sp. FL0255]|nr:ankyrin repeat-containing domain protein [Xylariaceae sp. FL0255]
MCFKRLLKLALTLRTRHSAFYLLLLLQWHRRNADEFVLDEAVLDLLLEASRKQNIMGPGLGERMDLLHLAIARCNFRTVEMLISRGFQLHSRPDSAGNTMLHSALCSAICTDEWGGSTILESALSWPSWWLSQSDQTRDSAARLRLFLLSREKGAQLNTSQERRSGYEMIKHAILSGADICSVGTGRETDYMPLQYAISKGRLKIARQLIARGADINVADMFEVDSLLGPFYPGRGTTLNVAIRRKSIPLVNLLLVAVADVNPVIEYPPLPTAIEVGSMEIFCFLLDAGADVNALTRREHNPKKQWYRTLDIAVVRGRLDMEGSTPYDGAFELAIKWRRLAIAEILERRIAQWGASNTTTINSQTCPAVEEVDINDSEVLEQDDMMMNMTWDTMWDKIAEV